MYKTFTVKQIKLNKLSLDHRFVASPIRLSKLVLLQYNQEPVKDRKNIDSEINEPKCNT